MRDSSSPAFTCGLVGMGGIGKSTLAKAIYDDIDVKKHFHSKIVFVEVGRRPNKTELQKLLLRKLVDPLHKWEDRPPAQVEGVLRSHLKNIKALVILDDVWKGGERLVHPKWLAPGSCIIVTTRDLSVVTKMQTDEHPVFTYRVEALSREDARGLLCQQAACFPASRTPSHLEEEINEALDFCQNLPLALSVLGAQVSHWKPDDKLDKACWRTFLKGLRNKEFPVGEEVYKDVYAVLRTSLEEASQSARDAFIIICCMIPSDWWREKGRISQWLCGALAADDDLVKTALQELEGRHLLTWDGRHDEDEEDEARFFPVVHDLLQDVANAVADEAPDFLLAPPGGTHVSTSTRHVYLEGPPVPDMRFGASIRSCVLLSCEDMPPLLSACNSLGALYVAGGCKSFPNSPSSLAMLRVLRLVDCKQLTELPDAVAQSTRLTDLHLLGCSSLRALPARLGDLTGLRTLDLSGCMSLKALPESIGSLSALSSLSLSGCSRLTMLPATLGGLTGLKTLDLDECNSLKALPESIGSLSALISLNLLSCGKLTAFPATLGSLTGLITLELRDCSSLQALPESLCSLTQLESLALDAIPTVAFLPELCASAFGLSYLLGPLRAFAHQLPQGMTHLPPSLGSLKGLTSLELGGRAGLRALPESVTCLEALTYLDVSLCISITHLPEDLGSLHSLQSLSLNGLCRLTELPQSLCQLSQLLLLECMVSGLVTLPESLGSLDELRSLRLSGCGISSLPESVGALHKLTELSLRNCHKLTKLPESLGDLAALTRLDVSRCRQLESLPQSLGSQPQLSGLNVCGCNKLRSVAALPPAVGEMFVLVKVKEEWEDWFDVLLGERFCWLVQGGPPRYVLIG